MENYELIPVWNVDWFYKELLWITQCKLDEIGKGELFEEIRKIFKEEYEKMKKEGTVSINFNPRTLDLKKYEDEI